MNWRNVAKTAYEKYVEHMLARGIVPAKKPFEGLDPAEQEAWIEAVKEACDIQAAVVMA